MFLWFGGVLLGFGKVLHLRFPRFCHRWDVKPPGWIYFILQGFRFHLRLMDLKLTPSSIYIFFFFIYLFILFAYRMARGYEEVSSS